MSFRVEAAQCSKPYATLIGDGQVNYRKEKIFETYYSIGFDKWTFLTLDYQFITNPAYNADRGPVSIYTARFHASF